MQSKSLLIAIAAFALTTTGVQAHSGTKNLSRVGINKDQIEAFQQARELRESGDITAARDALIEAGVDEKTLKKMSKAKKLGHYAINEAVEANDYEAFKLAIEGSPLADIVTSKDDFDLFVEAHNLKERGDFDEAKEIFSELGIDRGGSHNHRFGMMNQNMMSELSDEQKEALQVARQSNDRDTVRAILREAGLEKGANLGSR